MNTRIKLLIGIGILVYLSLSLYHHRQVKNIRDSSSPGAERPPIALQKQDSGGVQLSTTEEEQEQVHVKSGPVDQKKEETQQQRKTTPELQPEQHRPTWDAEIISLRQQIQTISQQKEWFNNTLQEKKRENEHLTRQTKDMMSRVASLQSNLNRNNSVLQDKDKDLLQAHETIKSLQQERAELNRQLYDSHENSQQLETLKASYHSKAHDLEQAIERIISLSERVQQSELNLAESNKTIEVLHTSFSSEQAEKEKAILDLQEANEAQARIKTENKKLFAEIGSLHKQLKEMKSSLAMMEEKTDRAQLKAEAMLRYGQEQSKLLAPSKMEAENLRLQLNEQYDNLDKAEEALSGLKESKEQLSAQLVEKDLTIQELSDKVSQLQFVTESLAEAKRNIEDLINQLNEKSEHITAQETSLSELTLSLTAAQSSSKTAEQEIESLETELSTLQVELASERKENESISTELEHAKSSHDQLQSTLQQISSHSENLAQESAVTTEQLQSALAEITSLESALADKTTQVDQLSAGVEQAQITAQQLLDAESSNTTLTETLAQAEEKINQQELNITEIQTQFEASRSEVNELNQSLENARENEKDKTIIAELHKEISQLENQIADQAQVLVAATDNVSLLENAKQDLTTELNEAKQKITEFSALENELAQTTEALNEAKQKKQAANEMVKSLRDELEQQKTRNVISEEDFATLKQEKDDLQDELSTLRKEKIELQNELNELIKKTTDTDNDGVADAEDNCPDTVQGAVVDSAGCEMDSDQDGLVDRLDLCPQSPANTEVNEFGCQPESSIVLQKVTFNSGTATLSAEAKTRLNLVTAILRQYPGIRFEVGGHTDNIGDPERNQTISEMRASAVKEYLINQGVDADQLESRGYGPEIPIGDNNTAKGRTANRRVELKIIQE